MREIIQVRRAKRRDALRPTGINADNVRIFGSQVATQAQDLGILSLPPFGASIALQDESGALLYMVDLDPLDSAPLG